LTSKKRPPKRTVGRRTTATPTATVAPSPTATTSKTAKKASDRSSFFVSEIVNVYPDTLAWISDFTYSFNENLHDNYFWHPAYDEYPVVGVSWKQSTAFANWRTHYRNSYLRENNDFIENEFRLPTEAEWEYAARGGRELTTYPWGGPYTTNSKGCFLANFKPGRGNLVADGGMHPVRVHSYEPNEYGLYDMAGNVAEWTSTAFDEASYYYVSDLSPDFKYSAAESDAVTLKRKVIRGGSWKDVAIFMQNGMREKKGNAKKKIRRVEEKRDESPTKHDTK